MKRTSAAAAFTLIELMIVVIIIAALAGMVVPHLVGRQTEMKKKIAKGDIANITTAIKMYYVENDSYPKALGDLLKKSPSGTHPYLENEPVDPWGRTYQYKYPGVRNPSGFDLFSAGVDGSPENDDDIGNWKSQAAGG